MAVFTPQGGKVTSWRVPAGRHDLLWSGKGLREYIQTNRNALLGIAPAYDEAAKVLFRELKKVPPADPRFTGRGGRVANFADHRIALRKMRDHILAATGYLEEAARHLGAAWSIYVALYGEPESYKRHKSGGFHPDK